MTILAVYHPVAGAAAEPPYPASDQHPDAVRYLVGDYYVDAIGEEPGAADVQALLAPPLPNLQPFQFFAMLELSGYESALNAYVNGMQGAAKVVARKKLDKSLSFRRDNDLVEAARVAIGLAPEQLDALWVQAAALK